MVSQTTGQPLPNGVTENSGYGYGLGIEGKYDSTFKTVGYGHDGSTFGFNSMWEYLPTTKTSFVISFTQSGYSRATRS